MTKERAITLIKSRCPQNPRKPWGVEYKNACEMAIKALDQEPCDDCISRESVKAYKYHRTMYPNFEDYVDMLPSVTPQPKMGYWIIIDDCELFMAKCSECGEIVDSRMISKYPYCHCGAKMEEVGE